MKAFLLLEDGTVFEGTHIGADKEVISEIVFNTSMTGYLEVLTDPSYAGQAVCMTYPLVGNYGVCREDMESGQPWPDGLIVRELSRIPSNFRSECSIQQFLSENGVPGIAGIDTRALTRILREKGTMNGMITTNADYNLDEIMPKLQAYSAGRKTEQVTCKAKYTVAPSKTLEDNGPLVGYSVFNKADYEAGKREIPPSMVQELNGAGLHVAVLDLGVKKSLVNSLARRGCTVTVYPAQTKAEEIIADGPDGILLSNGPGNPKEYGDIIEEVKKLYNTDIAIWAIGLGHQLMALAAGADTYKLKSCHGGSNYPVKELATGRVAISSQNHSYAVDTDKLEKTVAVPAFVNVNDGTNEGLAYTGKNIFSIQYYPSESLICTEKASLYNRFIQMMRGLEKAENHTDMKEEK